MQNKVIRPLFAARCNRFFYRVAHDKAPHVVPTLLAFSIVCHARKLTLVHLDFFAGD
jgi:hypothetical protein